MFKCQTEFGSCECICHEDDRVVHAFPCCMPCKECGKMFAPWHIDAHESRCLKAPHLRILFDKKIKEKT